MEHCHGEPVTSLLWEQLPGKPCDVIALEAVAMVTELAEVAGKKGLSSDGCQETFPPTGIKKRLLFIFDVPGRAACDSKTPLLCVLQHSLPGLFLLISGILPTCFHCWMLLWTSNYDKMEKSCVVLWSCIRWDCVAVALWFFLFAFLGFWDK